MTEKLDLNLMLVFDALMKERSVTRARRGLGVGTARHECRARPPAGPLRRSPFRSHARRDGADRTRPGDCRPGHGRDCPAPRHAGATLVRRVEREACLQHQRCGLPRPRGLAQPGNPDRTRGTRDRPAVPLHREGRHAPPFSPARGSTGRHDGRRTAGSASLSARSPNFSERVPDQTAASTARTRGPCGSRRLKAMSKWW